MQYLACNCRIVLCVLVFFVRSLWRTWWHFCAWRGEVRCCCSLAQLLQVRFRVEGVSFGCAVLNAPLCRYLYLSMQIQQQSDGSPSSKARSDALDLMLAAAIGQCPVPGRKLGGGLRRQGGCSHERGRRRDKTEQRRKNCWSFCPSFFSKRFARPRAKTKQGDGASNATKVLRISLVRAVQPFIVGAHPGAGPRSTGTKLGAGGVPTTYGASQEGKPRCFPKTEFSRCACWKLIVALIRKASCKPNSPAIHLGPF